MRLTGVLFLNAIAVAALFAAPAFQDSLGDITVSDLIKRLEDQAARYTREGEQAEQAVDLYTRIGDLYLEIHQVDKAVAAYLEGAKIAGNADYVMQAARKIHRRANDPVQAARLLSKAPTNRPEMARGLIWASEEIVNLLYREDANLTSEQQVAIVEAAEEVLTAITVTHRGDSIGEQAELRLVRVRWLFEEIAAREGKRRWEDVEESRRESLEDFIKAHAESPIASQARLQLGEVLMWRNDAVSASRQFQAVIDDEYAREREKLRATVMLAGTLVRGRKLDEAKPLLVQVTATEPNPEDHDLCALLARACLDLGRIHKHEGDADAAKASFERAERLAPPWADDVRREAAVLLGMGSAQFALGIEAVRQKVYEAEGEPAKVAAGVECRAYDVVSVRVGAHSATGDDFPYQVRFSSPKLISAREEGRAEVTQGEDSSGFHVRYEGTLRMRGPEPEPIDLAAVGENRYEGFPRDDVSMVAASTAGEDGTFAISVRLVAPAGSRLSVAGSEYAGFVAGEISPSPMHAGPWGIEFRPCAGSDELTYTFKVKPSKSLAQFIPRLTLRIPGTRKPKSADERPTEPVKEIPGVCGDVSYRLSSPDEFWPHQWIDRDETVVVIAEQVR